MCFVSPKMPSDPAQTAPKVTPAANAPDNGTDATAAGDAVRRKAAAANGTAAQVATGGQGLSNQLANTTKTVKGLLQ